MDLRRKTSSNIQNPTSCSQKKISTKPSIRSRICDFDPPRNELEGKIPAKIGLHIHIQEFGHAGAVRDNFLLSTPTHYQTAIYRKGNASPTVGRTSSLVLRFRTIKNTFWRPCFVSDGVEVLRTKFPSVNKFIEVQKSSKSAILGDFRKY